MTTINDATIASAMRRNAEDGFKMLMKKYKTAVYWHTQRLLVSHDDAQDATQETLIRVFRTFDRFKGDSPLGAWIYRIATNEALRILEQRSRKGTRLTLDDPSAGTTQMIADGYVDYSDLESIKLQKAILALPTKQQLAFNLRYYDELDYDEIASIIGTTAAGAKASYHIAKEKIIKYMNSTI